MLDTHASNARRLRDPGLPSFFRPRDAAAAGIPYAQLRRMEAAGLVEREAWGLYGRADADTTRHRDVAAVCFRFRSKVGLDVALGALDDALLWNKATRSQIRRAAEACRARSLLEPLLRARSY